MSLPPPRLIGTLEWAGRHISLDGVPFRAADYPWLEAIARTVDRERNAKFLLLFPPQVFKTLFLQLRLLRNVAVEPVRTLWYSVTSSDAQDLSDEKLYPLMEATPAVMAKFPTEDDKRGGKRMFRFVDAPVSMLSAEVQAHRNSRSGEDIFCDEAWQYEAGQLAEIFARSDDYEWSRRLLLSSTGPTSDDAVDTLWQQSHRYEWRVACLHCDQQVPLEFGEPESVGGLKWDSDEFTREPDGRWRVTAAQHTVRWVCPSCLKPTKFTKANLAKLNDPARGACYHQANPTPHPRVFAWRAEACVFRDWADLVGEWLTASNSAKLGDLSLTEEFIRKRRVRAWNPAHLIGKGKALHEGDYNLGDPWPAEGKDAEGNPLRVMYADVQQGHYWVVVRQFSNLPDTFGHSRLLHFEQVFTDGQLAGLAQRLRIPAGNVLLDSAWETQRVRQECIRHGFTAVNGIGETATRETSFPWPDGIKRIYSELRYHDAYIGTDLQGLFPACLEYLYISKAAKGALMVVAEATGFDGRAIHTIPRDAPDAYRRQRLAEIPVKKRSPKNPEEFYVEWRKLGPNHAFDCEVGINVHARLRGYYGRDGGVPEQPTPPAP
jgi:hypothetical protein